MNRQGIPITAFRAKLAQSWRKLRLKELLTEMDQQARLLSTTQQE